MKTNFTIKAKRAWMNSILAGVLVAFAALTFYGCADYASVGISSGYYAPDYRPYYVDYGYDGYPWWGPGPYYAGVIVIRDRHGHRKIVRKDVDVNVNRNVTVNRNIYYGGHHLRPAFRNPGVPGARSMRRDRR